MPRKNQIPASELEIASRFKMARTRARAPRSFVAAKLGVDSQTIARIELGRVPLKYNLAAVYCNEFNVSPLWLATGAGSAASPVALPDSRLLGVKESDLFSEVFATKVITAVSLRSEAEMVDLCSEEAGQRSWCVDELNTKAGRWFRRVPAGRHFDLLTHLEAEGEAFVGALPRDSWAVEARRRVDMDQLERSDREQVRPAIDLHRSRLLRRVVAPDPYGPQWDSLVFYLRLFLQSPGRRHRLIQDLQLDGERLGQWLSGKEKPDIESALKILSWAAREEIKDAGNEVAQKIFAPSSRAREVNEVDKRQRLADNPDVRITWSKLRSRLERVTSPAGKQAEAAAFVGVNRSNLNRWVNGQREPGADAAFLLLEWVTAEEAKQQSSQGALTPGEPKAQTERRQDNETKQSEPGKPSPGRKKKSTPRSHNKG